MADHDPADLPAADLLAADRPPSDDVAPDGSPVAVYLAVPVAASFGPLLDALRPPGRVLDLGCGVGRLAGTLADRGFEVTGVDESPAMLRHVPSTVRTIRSRIETLRLGRRFDVVVLASHLVNTAERSTRAAFLDTVRRHLAPGGVAAVEHHDASSPVFAPGADAAHHLDTPDGPLEVRLRIGRREGRVVSACASYRLADRAWDQPFTAELLDDAELVDELARHDLEVAERLGPTWLLARPAGGDRPGSADARAVTGRAGGR